MQSAISTKVKLDPEGFNDLADKEFTYPIIAELESLGFEVDDDPEEQFWANTYDTLVMKISDDKKLTAVQACRMATCVHRLDADEFNYCHDSAAKVTYIRLWWD